MSAAELASLTLEAPSTPPASGPLVLPTTLHILYGSEMGNAELVADNLSDALIEHGQETECLALNDQPVEDLAGLGVAFFITSTCGEGDMPYCAEQFWKALSADDAPSLAGLSYSVLALGDSGYTYFCEAGVKLDARLAELGATRIAPRVDCDVSYVEPSDQWIAERVEQLFPTAADESRTDIEAGSPPETPAPRTVASGSRWTRDNAFEATLRATRLLSEPGSAKEIRHYEIDISGSQIEYQPGDSMAIVPQNSTDAVDRFLQAAGLSGTEIYEHNPVRLLAEMSWELRFPSAALLDAVAKRAPETLLGQHVESDDHSTGEDWIREHSVAEVLRELRTPLDVSELGPLMSPIRYRAYSIASSPTTHPEEVHFTVATQRNAADAAVRSGVGSGYLADLVSPSSTLRVYPLPNRSFRLPADPTAPIIMVGPGVGVAPFRSFLLERAEQEGRGPSWLFFGDQHESTDYIYADDWRMLLTAGTLTKIDTAFSRDSYRKVYVQDRIREHAAEVIEWLQQGAYFYICGDGKRMATDVDSALTEIATQELGVEAGAELIEQLHREKRYLRDVY